MSIMVWVLAVQTEMMIGVAPRTAAEKHVCTYSHTYIRYSDPRGIGMI